MSNAPPPDRVQAVAALSEILHDVPVVMVTARLTDGSLRSMPMARARVAFDGTLWLFADPTAAAISELQTHPQVNVSYADSQQCRYVSLSGVAEVVQDRRQIAALWNPDYREWLPRGLQDPQHGLLRVTVQHAEYWDATHSMMRQIGGLMMGVFTGTRPPIGDHTSIDWTESKPPDSSDA
jgi:general stress protein 26